MHSSAGCLIWENMVPSVTAEALRRAVGNCSAGVPREWTAYGEQSTESYRLLETVIDASLDHYFPAALLNKVSKVSPQ